MSPTLFVLLNTKCQQLVRVVSPTHTKCELNIVVEQHWVTLNTIFSVLWA